MAKRITDEERIIGFFHANKGTEKASTLFNIIRGVMRQDMTPAVKPARKRRGRPPKATFVQAQEGSDA